MKKSYYWFVGIAILFTCCESSQDKRVQEEAKRNGQELRNNIENATGENTSIQDVYSETETVHVNSKEQLK